MVGRGSGDAEEWVASHNASDAARAVIAWRCPAVGRVSGHTALCVVGKFFYETEFVAHLAVSITGLAHALEKRLCLLVDNLVPDALDLVFGVSCCIEAV